MVTQPDTFQTLVDALRFRKEAPLWMLPAFLGFLALIAGLIYWGWRRQRRQEAAYLHRSFTHLAREKGLREDDANLLWHLAGAGGCENPLFLLTSVAAFDRCIDRAPPDAVPEHRLPILRHKLGFDAFPLGWVLTHTRDIAVGLRMWVGFKRDGLMRFCHCVLVENTPAGLLVTPIVKADEEAFKALVHTETVYVRFWRRGDTEYQFRTHLLPGTDPDRVTLWLAHTDTLNRVQRRDFFRLSVHLPVSIYGLSDNDDVTLPPEVLRARTEPPMAQGDITDLSAGGAALHAAKSLPHGSYVWLAPIGESPFALAGVSARILEASPDRRTGYRHRLEFENLDDIHHDMLARQIHHAQISPGGLADTDIH